MSPANVEVRATSPDRTLLRGATLVPVDRAYDPEFVGDLLIEGKQIAAIGPRIEVDANTRIVDVTGSIVAPGLVDTHRHTWQSPLRYVGADWTILHYQHGVWRLFGPQYTPDDMELALRIGLAEAANAGITQLFDWNHNLNSPAHTDATIRAHRASGLRVILGYGQSSQAWWRSADAKVGTSGVLPSDDIERVQRDWYGSDDALGRLAIAARGPEKSPMDIVRAEWEQARRLGIRISVHVGNGVKGLTRPIAKLADADLLGDDTTYVHCNSVSDEEIEMVVASGGTASCTPELESHMGHGRPAVDRFLAAGLRPSLSVDTCTNVSGDLFAVMRATLSVVRAAAHQRAFDLGESARTVALTTGDVLEFATLRGAIANGLSDRSGSLTPGKEADLVVIGCDQPNMFPMSYAAGSIVMGASFGNVDAVYVAGRAVKERGRLVDVDLVDLRRRAEALRDRMFEAAGTPRGPWLPDTTVSTL